MLCCWLACSSLNLLYSARMDLTEALGWLGMVLALAGTQADSKRTMFALDALCSVTNAVHFVLKDAIGGAIGQAIFLFMSVVGLTIVQRPSLAPLFFAVYPLLAMSAWHGVSEKGMVELLPMSVVLLAAVGKQLDNMLLTRLLILASNVPALLYGYAIASSPYVVSTAVFTAFSAVAVWKETTSAKTKAVDKE